MSDSRLQKITHIVVDVDGTLTDGGIYYDCNGNELKRFHVSDGVGMLAVQKAGIKLIVLTGRKSACVTRRMQELGVSIIEQNVRNKYDWIVSFMDKNGLSKDNIAYIGDDINDIKAMKITGYVACPVNACSNVRAIADFIASVSGGNGAFREFANHLLNERDELDSVLEQLYA